MIFRLPDEFDYDHPSVNLLYCPNCCRYQHFHFVTKFMECYGCGKRYQWTGPRVKVRPYDSTNRRNKGSKYGPPKFLLCMNALIDHPDWSSKQLYDRYWCDTWAYSTVRRWVSECRSLIGLEPRSLY